MNIIVPKIGAWINAKDMYVYTVKVTNEVIYTLIHCDIDLLAGVISRKKLQTSSFKSWQYIGRKEGDELSMKLGVENYEYCELVENGAITICTYRDYGFVIDGHLILIPKDILSLHETMLTIIDNFHFIKENIDTCHIQLAKEPKEAIHNKILSLVSHPIKSELEYYELFHRTLSGICVQAKVKDALRLMAYVITKQNARQ